ncbi:hypothetical protein [Saccharopolyspora sp. ASAGF58]|uniref:hypothetical protein n=1 Tax=Saccharopolyspora sp. ASAGF58 TaxID=2719023 RepID=UPI0014476D6E|nr:hypothetical protein [Saccharopolyspora sp. ASAGF58]
MQKLYTAEVNNDGDQYTLTVTDHRLATTETADVPKHMVDQIPMLISMIRMATR